MSATNRDASIKITLGYEGGYTNDPHDPGGATNWGITIIDARLYWKKDATAADVKAMPLSVAIDIYQKKYWAKMNCDADPAGVDFATFDYGVNSGTGRAVPCRAANKNASAVEWVKGICADRLTFLHHLTNWKYFGKGWGPRVANVEARGVKMALQDEGHAPEVVQKKLQDEGAAASTQAKKEVAKAGGTIAAPSSTQIPDAPHHLDLSVLPHWLPYVVAAVVVAAVIVFVWRWWANSHRAAAYAAVAAGG